MSSQEEILVFGANGTQGRPLVAELRERGLPVRALVRSEEKGEGLDANIVVGSLDDEESLRRAASGVRAAAIILSSSVTPATLQAHAEAALRAVADVPHVVMSTSSVVPRERTGL